MDNLFFIDNSPFFARLDQDHFELMDYDKQEVRFRGNVQDSWTDEATAAAEQLKQNLWWRMPYRGAEQYFGPYYSMQEALDEAKKENVDYTYLTKSGNTAWILPADFFDESHLRNQFLESLTEDWNEQGPVEDTWIEYWGKNLDLEAMANAMANAMRQEIVRQKLRPYGLVEEDQVIGPIDPRTGEEYSL